MSNIPPVEPVVAIVPVRSRVLGTLSLVFGIIAVATAAIPLFNYVDFAFAGAAIVLGIFALVTKRGAGRGLAGLIIGAVGLILTIVFVVVYAAAFSAVGSAVKTENKKEAKVDTVEIQVTSATPLESVTWDLDGKTEVNGQDTAITTNSFDKKFNVTEGVLPVYSAIVTSGAQGGNVEAKLIVNGKTVSDQTSDGPYATVSLDNTAN